MGALNAYSWRTSQNIASLFHTLLSVCSVLCLVVTAISNFVLATHSEATMASLYIGESGARSRFRRSATVLLDSGDDGRGWTKQGIRVGYMPAGMMYKGTRWKRHNSCTQFRKGYVEANFPAGLKKFQYLEGKSGRVNAVINSMFCCACAI